MVRPAWLRGCRALGAVSAPRGTVQEGHRVEEERPQVSACSEAWGVWVETTAPTGVGAQARGWCRPEFSHCWGAQICALNYPPPSAACLRAHPARNSRCLGCRGRWQLPGAGPDGVGQAWGLGLLSVYAEVSTRSFGQWRFLPRG